MHISLCCLAWDVLLNFDGDERQARTVNISSNKSDARQNMQIKQPVLLYLSPPHVHLNNCNMISILLTRDFKLSISNAGESSSTHHSEVTDRARPRCQIQRNVEEFQSAGRLCDKNEICSLLGHYEAYGGKSCVLSSRAQIS